MNPIEEARREASSETRALARFIKDMHVGLIDEGYTPDQAMRFVVAFLAEAANQPEGGA